MSSSSESSTSSTPGPAKTDWVVDVPCTVCGCICDDLRVRVAGDRIAEIQPACPLAEPWFAAVGDQAAAAVELHGNAVGWSQGVEAAAQLLSDSRAPFVFGLSRSSTAGQRAAIKLAEALGGTVDTTASLCHGPSIVAIQAVGEATCTLGEVRQRGDLVLFWRADPETTHPRHLERYSAEPTSEFLPGGRTDRRLLVVDQQRNATVPRADGFFQLDGEDDLELIWELRRRLQADLAAGKLPAAEPPATESLQAALRATAPSGLAIDQLYEQLINCRYGVVFFGLGLAQSDAGHANVEALLRLVAELNQVTRFSARRLRIPGDVAGADSVLCWMTGYPYAVNFARGYPRYNPGEYTLSAALERDEVDCCVLVGSECLELMPEATRAKLADIPTIVLDYPHVTPPFTPHVRFSTAIYGVHRPGTAYRMDEVPLPLRSLMPSQLPSDEEVLQALQAAWQSSPTEGG